ncbi:transcriptional regulator [Gallibacterium melopsittaci]|uniref:Transcriptional regulator n=1 Tax=Gallibacterium melopsittaci TaxID=516063 RepID=A0ABV6HZ71_9PAST
MGRTVLEKALTEAIAECEKDGEAIEKQITTLQRQLKDIYQKMADYRTALNHSKNTHFSTSKKARNARFLSSPQQLIASILKKHSDKWLSTNEITRQAMVLDGQKVGHTLPTAQIQTIYTVLQYLMKKALVEKCWKDKKCYWRLKVK